MRRLEEFDVQEYCVLYVCIVMVCSSESPMKTDCIDNSNVV